MTKPVRIQRKRTKGWRMPPNTVYVGRPTKWGNAFSDPEIDWSPLGIIPTRQELVNMYANWLDLETFEMIAGEDTGKSSDKRRAILTSLSELRGKNLACWCPLSSPCHAKVLLELANA